MLRVEAQVDYLHHSCIVLSQPDRKVFGFDPLASYVIFDVGRQGPFSVSLVYYRLHIVERRWIVVERR